MEKRRYQIFRSEDNVVFADFTINVASPENITNAEQDIILLDGDGKAVAEIQIQPGFDRREIPIVQ